MEPMWEILRQVSNYIYMLLLVVAFVWACTWRGGRGKALLCVSLLLTVIAHIAWQVLIALVNRHVLPEYSSVLVQSINLAISMILDLSGVLLLCFVIVARGSGQNQAVASSRWRAVANLTAADRASILQRREWTYLIDVLIINAASYGILFAALAIAVNPGSEESATYLLVTLGIACPSLFCMFKDSFAGKSLGKLMTGLRVVNANTGRPIGPIRSMARNVLFLVPCFPIVELIVANVRQDRRRLGDLMAGTVVVRDRMAASSPDDGSLDPPTIPMAQVVGSPQTAAKIDAPAELPASITPPPKPAEECIRVTCACGAKIKVSSRYAGRSGKCPRCKTALTIPSVTPELHQ